MSRILCIIRDIITHSADKSSRASGTRWVRPPSAQDDKHNRCTPSVYPQSPYRKPYKSGIRYWREYTGASAAPHAGGDNQITVNAPLQKQQCFIKLDLRAVRSAVHFFQPAAEGNRTAFNHMYFRVIVRIAVQICRIQKIQHFPDFIFRHVIKPQQGAVQMHITRNRHNGIYHKKSSIYDRCGSICPRTGS